MCLFLMRVQGSCSWLKEGGSIKKIAMEECKQGISKSAFEELRTAVG